MQTANKPGFIGWTAWILGSTFFLTEYFVRISTGVLGNNFIEEFHAKATSIGLLSGFFYYSYISMQIPVGILVDSFGVRKLLSSSCIIFGLACLLFSTMQSLELGYLSRFIMGFVGAFAFVSTLKLITIYFPENKFALLAGITQGGGMVGAVIGAAPMVYIFNTFGWRNTFVVFSGIFITLGIIMFIIIRDKQQNPSKDDNTLQITNQTNIKVLKENTLLDDIKLVLSSKQTWLNCLFIGLMYAPTEVFGEQWGTLFFYSMGNLSLEQSALQCSFIFIGMAIGCPLIGHISDRLGTRIKIMRACSLICLIILSFILYSRLLHIELPYIITCIIIFIYGIFASAIIPSYALATEINPKSVTGVALGITNMATVIIGSIFIPIIGMIIDKISGAYSYINGSSIPVESFYVAFILLPLSFILCFILTFFIKEPNQKATYSKSKKEISYDSYESLSKGKT